MKSFFLCLVACAALFSGCIDIYFDITRHADKTYTLKRTIVFGSTFLEGMTKFQELAQDSSELSLQAATDSIMGQFTNEQDIYQPYPGLLSYNLRDSVTDTTGNVITELHLRDLKLLQEVANEHFFAMKQQNQAETNKSLQMKSSHSKGKTTLEFSLIPEKDYSALSSEDAGMYEQYFAGHSIHIRVFSPDIIAPNASKEVLEIVGGEDWAVPYSDFPKVNKKHPKKAKIILRD